MRRLCLLQHSFPRKMKFVELTILKNDMNAVLKYLGKNAFIQFSDTANAADNEEYYKIKAVIDRLIKTCEFLGIENIAEEKWDDDDSIDIPDKNDEVFIDTLCSMIDKLKDAENKVIKEKQRVKETINEANAFSKMNVPFSDFEHLSFLTLRIGRIDPKIIHELREDLGERAVIIPLDNEDRFLAASSRKGRFALDSRLKQHSFEPVVVPDNYRGIPAEMLKSLNVQNGNLEKELEKIKNEKDALREIHASNLKRLVLSMNTALIIEGIKAKFAATENVYHFSGWIVADNEARLVKDLSALTGGRIAVHSYYPEEIPSVQSGAEKVPVALKHNAFVKGFESLVFSYGAPLYGTIDPTPVVAVFFTLMFGIMFGDVGQGFTLLFTGFLIKKVKNLARFNKFSTPLISVGIASMIMGLLAGSVFANEHLLVAPTRALTSALFGYPMDRILHLLPMAGDGKSVTKLLYFFAFTIAIGVVINSLGLIINIFNRCILKKYRNAFFSRTGLAGMLLFWYALFIAVRIILGGKFEAYDFIGLFIPAFCIFFGPVIWRIITKEKPVLETGLLTFIMEGFVEILETVSSYLSSTISFLRVGAFALAHAVFSFIIFFFTDELARSGLAGTFSAVLISITGNAIIIVLEGLIVAIQVIRLQYYEFFNKFFVETGVEFAPFRFRAKN